MAADVHHPMRRSTDHGWRRFVRENFYRDVWLLLITVIVLVSLAFGWNERSARVTDNSNRIEDLCDQSNRQNGAIIGLIVASMPPNPSRTEKAFVLKARRLFPQQKC